MQIRRWRKTTKITEVASYAALPPDVRKVSNYHVRKVSDFPFRGSLILRLRRPPRGAASQVFGKAKLFRTLSGKAA